MKLLGRTNGKKVVASISRHDYVSFGEGEDHISADGGQIGTQNYAGYDRGWGRVIWFEVAQNFAELYSDYQWEYPRKYGIWNIEDVRILEENEWPNPESIKEKAENFIWGTRGLSGHEPLKHVLLKDCSIDHLKAILANVSHIHEETKTVIEYLIKEKSLWTPQKT